MIKKQTTLIALVLVLAASFNSCKKDFDAPPSKEIPTGSLLTIADLRALYTGTSVRFNNNETVYATVTADEMSGNLYKNVYIEDATGAINLRLLASGGLYEGDSIRINLTGTVLGAYNTMLQLDSVDVDNNIVKQATGKHFIPTVVTMSQVNASMESHLIQLDNVQFANAELGQTYADAITLASVDHYLEDCAGVQVIVRSSGYSSFAGDTIPSGSGSLIAVVGNYNGTMQLYIRDVNDLTLTGTRCTGSGYLNKNFEDLSITSGGWITKVVTGSDDWFLGSFGGNNFAKMSNYNGSVNNPSETWLISPAVDLSGATAPALSINSAYKFTGAPIEVYVSNNYDGVSAPSSATWTLLSPALSLGSYTWTPSGNVDLSAYQTVGVYIAFKYTGSSVDGSTWEIDDINIQ